MRGIIFSWSESNIMPIQIREDDYIICADSGIEYAYRCGIKPDLAVGDYDSFDKSRLSEFDFEVITIRTEKDETDTHFAVMKALEKGCTEIIICGGIGGRLDHTLSNISSLKYIYTNGASGIITDGKTKIHYLPEHSNLALKYDKSYRFISLWALRDCSDINIKGLKYELKDAAITTSFSIGTSNEFIDHMDGLISVGDGELLVIIIIENN